MNLVKKRCGQSSLIIRSRENGEKMNKEIVIIKPQKIAELAYLDVEDDIVINDKKYGCIVKDESDLSDYKYALQTTFNMGDVIVYNNTYNKIEESEIIEIIRADPEGAVVLESLEVTKVSDMNENHKKDILLRVNESSFFRSNSIPKLDLDSIDMRVIKFKPKGVEMISNEFLESAMIEHMSENQSLSSKLSKAAIFRKEKIIAFKAYDNVKQKDEEQLEKSTNLIIGTALNAAKTWQNGKFMNLSLDTEKRSLLFRMFTIKKVEYILVLEFQHDFSAGLLDGFADKLVMRIEG